MDKFTKCIGIAAPLVRDNIDTDVIIPSREMTTVSKLGLADGLFAPWRYLDEKTRQPNPTFILNQAVYKSSSILISGKNFGCGSSREHAVWALKEFGFRSVIAESFGSIFFRNCVRNGILPIEISLERIENLVSQIVEDPQNNQLSIDLVNQRIGIVDGAMMKFSVAENDREMLLGGLDQIDETLKLADEIESFKLRDHKIRPWLIRPADT